MKYFTIVNGQPYEVEINCEGEVKVNGEARHVEFKYMGVNRIYSLLIDNQSFEVVVDVKDERAMRLARAPSSLAGGSGEATIRSPMLSMIVTIPVAVEQEVKKGTPVVILESMKMQNELKARRDGVMQNQVLVTTS